MTSSTQVGRIMGVTSKQTKVGPVYEVSVDGFKKPLTTWKADIAKAAQEQNGKLVNIAYTTKPETFTNDEGRVINFNKFYLDGVQVVEGDEGTLDDVLAPGAAAAQDTAVATTFTNGGPQSPSDAARQADIRRAVALKAAADLGDKLIPEGQPISPQGLLTVAEEFEAWLGRP